MKLTKKLSLHLRLLNRYLLTFLLFLHKLILIKFLLVFACISFFFVFNLKMGLVAGFCKWWICWIIFVALFGFWRYFCWIISCLNHCALRSTIDEQYVTLEISSLFIPQWKKVRVSGIGGSHTINEPGLIEYRSSFLLVEFD